MSYLATCRFCKKQEYANFLKYGPRHYAHLRCLHGRLTPEVFEDVLTNKVSRHTLRNIPFIEAKELGILPLLRKITGEEHTPQLADIPVIADRFPQTFGLRGFPGLTFRISRSKSYISEGVVLLYTQVLGSNGWDDFAKGTEAELRREIVAVQS